MSPVAAEKIARGSGPRIDRSRRTPPARRSCRPKPLRHYGDVYHLRATSGGSAVGALRCLCTVSSECLVRSALVHSRRALCPVGATAKAGCWKPVQGQAHAPLPASRLDIRACHPAAEAVTELPWRGFHAPLPSVAGAGLICLLRAWKQVFITPSPSLQARDSVWEGKVGEGCRSQEAALAIRCGRTGGVAAPGLVISCSRTSPNRKEGLSHHPSPRSVAATPVSTYDPLHNWPHIGNPSACSSLSSAG